MDQPVIKILDVVQNAQTTLYFHFAKYVKTGSTMVPVLPNAVTVSEENCVKNMMVLASMAAVKTSNPLIVKNVFPTNMAQTADLIVDIAKMVYLVPQKTEFAPKVAILDGLVIFV